MTDVVKTHRHRHAHHRRHRGHRAQGRAGDPGRRADGHRDPAVLRPPAAGPGRRLPAVPGRGGGPAQAGRLLHPDRRRRHGGPTQLTSPVAKKAQEGIMELLLINHPLDCPMCDKGGECPLQNQAMSTGRADTRFHEHKREYAKPITISTPGAARPRALRALPALHPVLRGDRRRQVHRPDGPLVRRADQHLPGRGRTATRRATTGDVPFNSYFSGNTVQICPVGALTGAQYRFRARPFDLVSIAERLRALLGRLRPAHRPPARQGAAPAGRRRPGGERGVELRQGPVGLPVRHRLRPASPPRWCATRRPVSCARPPGPRRCTSRPRGCARPATARTASAC